MSSDEMEKNYSPSQWSKRYKSGEMLFSRHCTLALNLIKDIRRTTNCSLDNPYGLTDHTKYDIYGSDLPNDAPVFIYINGGYWQLLNKDYSGFPVPVLVANKIKVITIGHDRCPKVKLRDIVDQIKQAIDQILTFLLNSGCRCVWIAGHSAGAHLAATLLHDEKWIERATERGYFHLIKGLLLISGIYNIKPLVKISVNKPMQLTEDEIAEFSLSTVDIKERKPIHNLKVIAIVGECDSPIFINETREYAQKVMSLVDNVEYILLRDDIDHFDIVENLLKADYVLTRMIIDHITVK